MDAGDEAGIAPTRRFARMGYGAWAGRQLEEFATLMVSSRERLAALLSLSDRRLREIARCYVRELPTLYLRPYLGDVRRDEVRVHYRADKIVSIERRHGSGLPAACAVQTIERDEVLAGAIGKVARATGSAGTLCADLLVRDERIVLIDLNPSTVLTPPMVDPGLLH